MTNVNAATKIGNVVIIVSMMLLKFVARPLLKSVIFSVNNANSDKLYICATLLPCVASSRQLYTTTLYAFVQYQISLPIRAPDISLLVSL